jgi:ABC-type bacteriocin/lantibiotic exporter with double-glycine peptidase domain
MNTWASGSGDQENISLQLAVTMMFLDWIYLSFLSWYLAKVWPSEYGTHEPWYFICLPNYWINTFCGCCGISADKVFSYSQVQQGQKVMAESDVPVEEITTDLAAQVDAKQCVDIRNLFKVFKTNTGPKVAVDNLNLTMYSGQITALLGHNGAGKTTTIGMLTGLFPADGGTAIIEGFDINNDMHEIRRNLGVCPQHDIVSSLRTFFQLVSSIF